MGNARLTRLPTRTRPEAARVASGARTASPGAIHAPPSGLAALQRMADASPTTLHLQTLRGLSDTAHQARMAAHRPDAPSLQSTPAHRPQQGQIPRSAALGPCVVQRASIAQVENCIGPAVSPAEESKKAIVKDLAEATGGQEKSLKKKATFALGNKTKGTEVDAAVKTEVENTAKQQGYGNDAAIRLVERQPFHKDEIEKNSTIVAGEGKVTSFYDVTRDDMQLQAHQLFFSNTYANGHWTMADNFRNPYLAAFFASDVIKVQKAMVDDKAKTRVGDLKTLTRANVVSDNGVAWARKNKIKDGPMSQDLLTSFLKETDNGKSSLGIAKQENVKIVSGTLSGVNDTGDMAYKFFSVDLDCATGA